MGARAINREHDERRSGKAHHVSGRLKKNRSGPASEIGEGESREEEEEEEEEKDVGQPSLLRVCHGLFVLAVKVLFNP
jgi:hypothetical protein